MLGRYDLPAPFTVDPTPEEDARADAAFERVSAAHADCERSGYCGKQPVRTFRNFWLPAIGCFALLAGWAVIALWWSAR